MDLMDLSLLDIGRAFVAISALVTFIVQAIWMMFQRPRVQAMLNKAEENIIKKLDSKYGYKEGEMFAEKEKTSLKINTLEGQQSRDNEKFKEHDNRIQKLENGK